MATPPVIATQQINEMQQQLLQCLAQQEEVESLESQLILNPLDPETPFPQWPLWVQEATKELQERAVKIEAQMDLGLVSEPQEDPLPLRLLRAFANEKVWSLIQEFNLPQYLKDLEALVERVVFHLPDNSIWNSKVKEWLIFAKNAGEQRTTCILYLCANTGRIEWDPPNQLGFLQTLDKIKDDDTLDWFLTDNVIFICFKIIHNNKFELLPLLLDIEDLDPNALKLLGHACVNDRHEIIEILLKDPRVDINYKQDIDFYSPFANTLRCNRPETVKLFLKDPRLDPFDLDEIGLPSTDVLYVFFRIPFLMSQIRIEPFLEILKLFLEDQRVRDALLTRPMFSYLLNLIIEYQFDWFIPELEELIIEGSRMRFQS